MLKRKNTILAIVIALVGVFTGIPVTQAMHADYQHAYRPYTVRADFNQPLTAWSNSQVNWTRARINNATLMPSNPLVCAEAFRVGGGKQHLGCLNLNLGANGFTQANWAEEFNVPTSWLVRPGTYRIVYTYQDQLGNWHQIKGVGGENVDGMFVH